MTPGHLASGHSLLGVLLTFVSSACVFGQDITVADALDCPRLQWACPGTYNHVARVITQNTNTHDGVDAVVFLVQSTYSGLPLDVLTTTVVGPGTLTFWYRVPNAGGVSVMNYGDTVYLNPGSSRVDSALVGTWTMATFRVGAGVHHLSWGVLMTQASQDMLLDEVKYVPDAGPPVITSQPQGQSGRLGDRVTFSATAESDRPLTHRWRKDGTLLVDDGRIVGTATLALTISAIQLSDVGNYSVVVSNDLGGTTSDDAALSLEPSIPGNDSSLGFRSSVFGFSVIGRPGATAVVESSADLTHWVPLCTNVLGATPFYFSDPASATTASRWYRVR